MVLPHITEEYFCNFCHQSLKMIDVDRTWTCPKCKNYILIRIITDNKNNACTRVFAKDLKEDEYILMDRNDDFRRIIRIIDLGDIIQLNIEGYGAWKVKKQKYILKLEGRWYY